MRYRWLIGLGFLAATGIGCAANSEIIQESGLERKLKQEEKQEKQQPKLEEKVEKPVEKTQTVYDYQYKPISGFPNLSELKIRFDETIYDLVPRDSQKRDEIDKLAFKNSRYDRIHLAGNKVCLRNTKKALSLIRNEDPQNYQMVKQAFGSILDDGKFALNDHKTDNHFSGSLLVSYRQYLGETPDYAKLIIGAATRTNLARKSCDQAEIEGKVKKAEQNFLSRLK